MYENRQGKGNVVRKMFADIDADVYVMIDGDATYDVKIVLGLIKTLQDEKLAKKPEVVALNKIDALDDKEVAKKQKALEKAIGKKVFAISAIAKKGVFDCLLEVNKYITRDRKRRDEDVVEEQIVVADKPWSPL